MTQFVKLVLRNDAARRQMLQRVGSIDSILVNQLRTVVFPLGHPERREEPTPLPSNIYQDWMLIACVRRRNVAGGV